MIKKYKAYIKKKEEISEELWFRLLNNLFNLFLATGTVLLLLYNISTKIPFTFHINDDPVMMQILNGSYTGTPDGHAIFIKYPLSWIMSQLYKANPSLQFGGLHLENVNWYVGTIVILYGFALIAVLFRLLTHFRCNRFLICTLYGVTFLTVWSKYYSEITFSIVAAFLGCAALAYLALEDPEEVWRPWNLIVLGILMTSSYCMRPSCFYMVIPFLLTEFVVKHNIMFLKSWKPWFSACMILLICFGAWYSNDQAYDTQKWQDFLDYNHERAYLQDYVGFPDYESNKDFYDSIGMDEANVEAMSHYDYCIDDDFSKDCIHKTYEYVKKQEGSQSLKDKIFSSLADAKNYCFKKEQSAFSLKYLSFYLWLVLLPLILVTLILRSREDLAEHIGYVIQSLIFAAFIALEWIYLAMKGRFPERVEVSIRIMMLTAALVMVCHLLKNYREVWTCRLHGILQIAIIIFLFPTICSYSSNIMTERQGKQEYTQKTDAEKGEVLAYCGQHPDNYYVLDTRSFTKASLPNDDYHQMNWILSGSWIAYSPLYDQKLADLGTDTLGSSFLERDNVYLITKGKKNIAALMARDDDDVSYEIVDEYCSSSNNFYEIYKVTNVN